ncbi:8529_t:CDS:2 [Racocetra fulgida]|uniref:8529_t:CDS:1 n=1 Tax=Racocetra fulgida TaxID=60492 RepID=A0A9N8VIR7_9GLOM|nr:8529_t:CDS:2 [Racocetra fulgida]
MLTKEQRNSRNTRLKQKQRKTEYKRRYPPLNFIWDRICPHCSVVLLTRESSKFCCNDEKRIIPLLPPYSTEINKILNNTNINVLSRKLNTLFSFTVIGVQAHGYKVPDEWITTIQNMLIQINPYVHLLQIFKDNPSDTAFLELQENTLTGEIAAIMHANNIINIQPRSIII